MGMLATCKHFEELADHLAEKYEVLLFDYRGVGKSTLESKKSCQTSGLLAADTLALVDQVWGPMSAVHLYGVSMGGWVAQELALLLLPGGRLASLFLAVTTAGNLPFSLPLPFWLCRFIASKSVDADKAKHSKKLLDMCYAPEAQNLVVIPASEGRSARRFGELWLEKWTKNYDDYFIGNDLDISAAQVALCLRHVLTSQKAKLLRDSGKHKTSWCDPPASRLEARPKQGLHGMIKAQHRDWGPLLLSLLGMLLLLAGSASASDYTCLDATRSSAMAHGYTGNAFNQWTDTNPCGGASGASSWGGSVKCATGVVTDSKLKGDNLPGPLTPLLSDCTSLSTVDLSNNAFTGSIPSSWSSMSSLTSVKLDHNAALCGMPVPSIPGLTYTMTNIGTPCPASPPPPPVLPRHLHPWCQVLLHLPPRPSRIAPSSGAQPSSSPSSHSTRTGAPGTEPAATGCDGSSLPTSTHGPQSSTTSTSHHSARASTHFSAHTCRNSRACVTSPHSSSPAATSIGPQFSTTGAPSAHGSRTGTRDEQLPPPGPDIPVPAPAIEVVPEAPAPADAVPTQPPDYGPPSPAAEPSKSTAQPPPPPPAPFSYHPPPSSPPPPPPPPPGLVPAAAPPTILLRGPAEMLVPLYSVFKDPGASAIDGRNGVLQANATVTGNREVNTSMLTPADDPYIITYTAVNAAGLAATPLHRTVRVVDPCIPEETMCTTGKCSLYGICLLSVTPTPTTPLRMPPKIQLINATYLGAVVQVKQGQAYAACAAGVPQTADAPCELGAAAQDHLGADLRFRVVACPSPTCLATGSCSGLTFTLKGLAACRLNTSIPVGSILQVPFIVFDQYQPPASASVTRSIAIAAPCSTGQYLCSGSCSPIPCVILALLNPATPPPQLSLTAVASSMLGASRALAVQYGSAMSVSLQPCITAGPKTGCAVVGTDPHYGDISSLVKATVAPVCDPADGATCAPCGLTYLQQSLCLPGRYLVNYTLMNTDGIAASPLQLAIDIYEAGFVHGSIFLIGKAAFQGVAICNSTTLSQEFFNGQPPPVECNGTVMGAASRSAISTFLETNRQAAGSAPLPLLQVIQMGADPQPQQISPVVDTQAAVAIAIASGAAQLVADQTAAAATLVALAQMAGPDAIGQATQAQMALQTAIGDYQASAMAAQAKVQATIISSKAPPSVMHYQFANVPAMTQLLRQSLAGLAQRLVAAKAGAAAVALRNTACGRGLTPNQFHFQVSSFLNQSTTSSPPSRRRLQQAADMPSGQWYGYHIHEHYQLTAQPAAAGQIVDSSRKRYFGGYGSNRVLGGMLLTQERQEAAPCGSRFSKLAHACEPGDPDLDGVPIHKNPDLKDPFGFDPVFGTYSHLWAEDLVGQEAAYYNTSQGSPDVDATGSPFAFTSPALVNARASFPVVFTTQMSADRAQSLLQYLRDGHYLGKESRGVTVEAVSVNGDARLYGYVRINLQWTKDGEIESMGYYAALPQLPYNAHVTLGRLGPVLCVCGMEAYLQLLAAVNQLYTLKAAFTAVQGIILVLLMIRWVQQWHFQPKLGIVTRTLARSLPDLAHLGVSVAVTLVVLAMSVHLILGERALALSTYAGIGGVHLRRDFQHAKDQLTVGGVELDMLERTSQFIFLWILPLVFQAVFVNYVMAIVLDMFHGEGWRAKKARGGTLADNVSAILRQRILAATHHVPTNPQILAMVMKLHSAPVKRIRAAFNMLGAFGRVVKDASAAQAVIGRPVPVERRSAAGALEGEMAALREDLDAGLRVVISRAIEDAPSALPARPGCIPELLFCCLMLLLSGSANSRALREDARHVDALVDTASALLSDATIGAEVARKQNAKHIEDVADRFRQHVQQLLRQHANAQTTTELVLSTEPANEGRHKAQATEWKPWTKLQLPRLAEPDQAEVHASAGEEGAAGRAFHNELFEPEEDGPKMAPLVTSASPTKKVLTHIQTLPRRLMRMFTPNQVQPDVAESAASAAASTDEQPLLARADVGESSVAEALPLRARWALDGAATVAKPKLPSLRDVAQSEKMARLLQGSSTTAVAPAHLRKAMSTMASSDRAAPQSLSFTTNPEPIASARGTHVTRAPSPGVQACKESLGMMLPGSAEDEKADCLPSSPSMAELQRKASEAIQLD
ncbi:hypothetical protein WJX72_012052 [[Myrmecia] bisecta]|uniref:Uncharacterized protein n=1 Tax=[Myrmecia] bisecta TaxID=41462 RepID=A0AAW1P669_9CHLO